MFRAILLSLYCLSLASCLFVPDNEGTITFNYILLNQDEDDVIGAILCDQSNVGQIAPFVNSRVDSILIRGTTARNLTVEREVDCFYQPNNAQIDTIEELGAFSATFPSDTYNTLQIKLLDENGAPILIANDADGTLSESFALLIGQARVTLTPGSVVDLSQLFLQQGLTNSVVAQELTIFPEFP